jgi:hypothetical protein
MSIVGTLQAVAARTINTYGQSATFNLITRANPNTYSPTTGTTTASDVTTAITVKVATGKLRSILDNNSNRRKRMSVTIAAPGPFTRPPQPDDTMTINGTLWYVGALVSSSMQGQTALYEVDLEV